MKSVSQSQKKKTFKRDRAPEVQLTAPGWCASAKASLENLILAGIGKNWHAVFDFDNTIICGDIGESTLALLVREGLISIDQLPSTLAPPFRAGGRVITPASVANLAEYYEAFLSPTAHGRNDPEPLANGYVWAVEAMQGLTAAQVVEATCAVHAMSEPMKLRRIIIRPDGPSWPVPFFYPEMVELIAHMITASFQVWIVSATNVWSVRWMVQHALNPALREHGLTHGIPPDHVIGIATLLTDDRNRLFKDSILVKEDSAYASLDMERLGELHLTSRLQFPVPTYSGKVACIWDALKQRPHFAAGDSPGDHAMLTFARNRLWIARLDKPHTQSFTATLARRNNQHRWFIQPVWCGEQPGFVPSLAEARRRHGANDTATRKSIAAWFPEQ